MSNLRTNYKDDVFTGKRKYNQINNGDGTISFDDVTEYAQVGDTYGAAQINETNDVINNLDSKAYKNTDSAENSVADNDYFPFFDVSANASKKTLWSNIKSILTNVFAIKTHASNATTYGPGSETLYGHVKLSDSYTSSAGAASAAIAASSKAVFDSYNANKNSITSLNGTVTANKATETEHYNSLTNAVNGRAPINHASTNTTYGKGSSTQFGHLKISDNYASSAGNADDGVAASSKAVSNVKQLVDSLGGVVTDHYNELKNELTANNNRIYMDYQNGKYGYNTAANRGADTFHPFRSGNLRFTVSGGGIGGKVTSIPMSVLNDIGVTIVTWSSTGDIGGGYVHVGIADTSFDDFSESGSHTFTNAELNLDKDFFCMINTNSYDSDASVTAVFS